MRGKLIVFEGLDRSGKSTQCARLAEKLKAEGHSVHLTRFPDRTTQIGRLINEYLAGNAETEDHVIHLLFSANRWEAVKTITSHLAHNTTVLIDRYYYSGIAYTSAKLNPSLSPHWAKQPDVGLPRPDVCLFLDLQSQDAEARGGFGEERYEKAEFQQRVRQAFQPLLDSKEVVRVDAKGSMEVVGERIWAEIVKAFREIDESDKPISLME